MESSVSAYGALGTYALSLAAGSLSTLSPCVLPLVPIVLATAVAAHRLGPYALAAGLTLSFSLLGVLLASIGASLGIDQEVLQRMAAAMLIAFGVLLLSTHLQTRFASAASGISGAGQDLISRLSLDGLAGQFVLGLLLGIVWSPCVGPTLGAAITLASQGQSLGRVTLQMALFGIGAGIPLIMLGSLSRQAMTRMRGKLLSLGRRGKQLMGMVMLLLGALILTGSDKLAQTWLVQASPDWLVRLTTSL
jgi:cytochrome c-type biogenesis protein